MSSLPGYDVYLPTDGKVCFVCGEFKPWDCFSDHSGHKDKKDGRCKDCVKKRLKIVKNLKNNPSTPPKPEVCDCCEKHPRRGEFCLDHDHKTLIFRGWICGTCNKAIGQLGDSVEGVLKALKYLLRKDKTNMIRYRAVRQPWELMWHVEEFDTENQISTYAKEVFNSKYRAEKFIVEHFGAHESSSSGEVGAWHDGSI